MASFSTHIYEGIVSMSATAIIKPSSNNCYVIIKAGGDEMTMYFNNKDQFDNFCNIHSVYVENDYREQD